MRRSRPAALASQFVNVFLDGMSFKNPINHGGVFGQNFGLGNPFPQIAIQEYLVETQNFGAETGQAGSAVISAITKTGGNEFHGSAFIEFQPKSFITKPLFRQEEQRRRPTTTASSTAATSAGRSSRASCTSTSRRRHEPEASRPRPVDDADWSAFPQNLDGADQQFEGRGPSSSGSISASSPGYVSAEDTVNLIGYLRRERQSGRHRRQRAARAMAAASGPTRTAISCSGGTMPAIS